jgi:chemotaxis signal transduction protein
VKLVRFRTGDGTYAVPVDDAREVRPTQGLQPLPSPRPGVAGLLSRGDVTVPVLDGLGPGRGHVLVVEREAQVFGLLVEEVTGVASVDDDAVAPPPPGQADPMVTGVVHEGEGVVLVVDVAVLGKMLTQ